MSNIRFMSDNRFSGLRLAFSGPSETGSKDKKNSHKSRLTP